MNLIYFLKKKNVSERKASLMARMSQNFNEDKTFIENYDFNYDFIDILKEERK